MSRHLRFVAVLVLAVLAFTGCDDDGTSIESLGPGTATGSGTGSDTEGDACAPGDPSDPALTVTLDEYDILPEEDELTRGPARFRAVNSGKKVHELYVVQARAIEGVPIHRNGSVDIEALEEDDRLLGELHGIQSGKSCDLELDLEPGTYVMLCNIRERGNDGVVNHFLQGMRTRFKVV